MEERFSYDSRTNRFFVNLEGFTVRSQADIDRIREHVEAKLAPLGKRVFAIVNYDNFSVLPDLMDTQIDPLGNARQDGPDLVKRQFSCLECLERQIADGVAYIFALLHRLTCHLLQNFVYIDR
jgi:hypothetical protein